VLKEVLEETYGQIIFQEQIQLVAEKIAGVSADESDSFRRLLTKRSVGKQDKAAVELKALKGKFIQGCIDHSGLSPELAEELFQRLAFFAGYGFNKSLHCKQSIKIYTCDGEFVKIKAIEDIISGDFVRSRDEKTGEQIFVKVIGIHDHGALPLYEATFDDGETVECTLDHKFRTRDGRMLPLQIIMKEGIDVVRT